MNRRRELTIQRISRIEGLADVESATQSVRHKAKAARAFTIEAALGTYMAKTGEAYSADYQDTYTPSYENQGQGSHDRLYRQMKKYEEALEECRLANAKSGRSGRRLTRLSIKEFEEVLADDPSAQYQLNMYRKKNGESDFDRLDANRCSGFLLYSYDRKGVHSVLGEHLTPGRHGASGTLGSTFAEKF